jgi:uncharacterized protein
MPLLINIRQLAARELALTGQIPVLELDMDKLDEIVRVKEPLQYDLVVQKTNEDLLIQGKLQIALDCQCVRCLKPFRQQVKLEGAICNLSLHGEEAIRVVNDCVDLTPYLRESILLEVPQHPVCERDCPGVPLDSDPGAHTARGTGQSEEASSAWAELNKLKF